MTLKSTPNPTALVLDSIIGAKLEGHPNGLTQTQLIDKFRSNAAYGPRYTFHPNAIKKAVARLSAEGQLTLSAAGNDLQVSLAPTAKSEGGSHV